jgi:hypothetical protein
VPEPTDDPIQDTAHAGPTPPPGVAPSPGAGAATRLWYLSSQQMTLGVVTAHPSDRVLEAPPIARGFVGQPLRNLVRWMGRQPGFSCQPIDNRRGPVPEQDPAKAARLIAEDFPTGPSAPSGCGRSVAGDLTRPDPNLTQAQLVVARQGLHATPPGASGGMEL